MTKEEKTHSRDLAYSTFHRSLGNQCFGMDLDWIEVRNGEIRALIEVTGNMNDNFHIENCKRFIWKRTEFQRKVLEHMSFCLKVPAYFVLHDKELTVFHVHEIPNIEAFHKMDKNQYSQFLKDL